MSERTDLKMTMPMLPGGKWLKMSLQEPPFIVPSVTGIQTLAKTAGSATTAVLVTACLAPKVPCVSTRQNALT